jgi:peptide deformylase
VALRKVLTRGNPILKKKSKAVKKITPQHIKLIKDMAETMKAAPGIGLAAPQVGINERIIVIDIGEGLIPMVNPKITKRHGRITFMEGCLSVPGLEGPVERSASICVKGMDPAGRQVTVDAEGLLSIVFQHEIDHLDGVLFVERVSDPSMIVEKESKKEETI